MSTKTTDARQFTRVLLLVICALATLCLVFFTLNLLEGPRLRRVEIDTTAVVKQTNQYLTMYVNQSLATTAKSQITIQPKVGFTVASNGETITVQFTQRLAYNTDYHVTVHNVRSSYRATPTATFVYHFRTGEPTMYYIHRNHDYDTGSFYTSKKSDQIFQTTLTGSQQSEVYSAPMIQDYVVSGNTLIVVTVNDDKTNSLFLVDTLTKRATKLTLPGAGTISDLHASSNERLIGFSFTSNEKDDTERAYSSVLFTMDLVASRIAQPVDGLDHTSLEVVGWQFAPDGTTILAETSDGSLLLIDTNKKHDPVPLGQDASITNFSYNGALISAESITGPILLDPLQHTRTPIVFKTIDGADPYPMTVHLLSNGPGYLARLQTYSGNSLQTNEYFVLNQSGSDKTIYQTHTTDAMISDYSLSPNDQYMSLELGPTDNNQYDDYPDNSKSYSVHTQLIDVANGTVVKDIDGFNITWN